MTQCPECSGTLVAGLPSCSHCGVWLSEPFPLCGCEENARALGTCVLCGVPVCGSCGTRLKGRLFCSDASHVAMLDTHVLLTRVHSVFDADWISANLSMRGLTCEVLAHRDDPGFYGLHMREPVRIFVPRQTEAEARSMMETFEDEGGGE